MLSATMHVLGQIFAKNEKNDPNNTFWNIKISKLSPKSEWKIFVCEAVWVLVRKAQRHVICQKSVNFEDGDFKFCTHIYSSVP